MPRGWRATAVLLTAIAVGVPGGCVPFSTTCFTVVPEQRCLDVRDPSQLPRCPIPTMAEPVTVTHPASPSDPLNLTLDEAIRTSLCNAKVIRVLVGLSAESSGQTIYDPAISNTLIDEARALFDPTVAVRNAFSQSDVPLAIFDPASAAGARITGASIDNYDLGVGVAKKTVTGGSVNLDLAQNAAHFDPGVSALNPQGRGSLSLGFTQPLLQGAGIEANIAPIIITRINTERSYFQFKDSVQELVRGTIEAYWAVVFARTDAWARRQQVEQGAAALARAEGRKRQGFGTAAELAQAQVALSNFKAAAIGSDANLLQREAALRNIMGLPPTDPPRFVPTTAPTPVRVDPKWDDILHLAEERRPDLIELKLILEADRQSINIAENQALPRVDATALYRWNGLEGETPSGAHIASRPGAFTDWTLGVNFSVPLGLRQSRAALRRSELVLARDRVNLEQGLHSAGHQLAGNMRNLAQFYEQYKAFKETRTAARINLEQQLAEYRFGRSIFLNVLQAITDWGNAVSSEAQALAQYNVELANLERQTGTILETHGVRFIEERYKAIGPLGILCDFPCYPKAVVPGPNEPKYPSGAEPAEGPLDRDKPVLPRTPPGGADSPD